MGSAALISYIFLVGAIAKGSGNICPAAEAPIDEETLKWIQGRINEEIKRAHIRNEVHVHEIEVSNLKVREVTEKEVCASFNLYTFLEYKWNDLWWPDIKADIDFDVRVAIDKNNSKNPYSLIACDKTRAEIKMVKWLEILAKTVVADKMKSHVCENVGEKIKDLNIIG